MDWLDEKLNCWSAEKDASRHRDSCDERSGNVIMSLAFLLLCSVYEDIKYENLLRS
jgi:hypothetical protein